MMLSAGIFVIAWRIVCALLLLLILLELTWAQRHDGESLRSLRGMLAAQFLVLCFPLAAALDSYTDFTPGFHLRSILEFWVWIAYATFATCMIRFWLSLHRWARQQKDGG